MAAGLKRHATGIEGSHETGTDAPGRRVNEAFGHNPHETVDVKRAAPLRPCVDILLDPGSLATPAPATAQTLAASGASCPSQKQRPMVGSA
jgi:hypothetical protein